MAPPIRVATSADAGQIAAIYAPIVTETPISFELIPPDASEMRRRIEETLLRFPWLVWDEGGRISGYVYASAHHTRAAYRWAVDVTVYIRADSRRRGLGRALYGELFSILKQQGFYVTHAGVTLPNEGSVGLHEALGFQPVGVYSCVGYKMGRWHDVGWWRLPLREPDDAPAEPIPFSQWLGRQ